MVSWKAMRSPSLRSNGRGRSPIQGGQPQDVFDVLRYDLRGTKALSSRSGGTSHVPLDHLWDMDGHFATEDVRQAVCFAMAHMTAEETEQLL